MVSAQLVRSPCVGICTATALGDAICRGCGRTFQEVIGWNGLCDNDKMVINERIRLQNNIKISCNLHIQDLHFR